MAMIAPARLASVCYDLRRNWKLYVSWDDLAALQPGETIWDGAVPGLAAYSKAVIGKPLNNEMPLKPQKLPVPSSVR